MRSVLPGRGSPIAGAAVRGRESSSSLPGIEAGRPARKVVFVAPSAYTLSGLATWLDYLVPGLQGAGWEAVLALTSGRTHDVGAYQSAHPARRCRIVANQTGTRAGRVRSLIRLVEEERPSIVACVNIVDVYEGIVRMRRRRADAPKLVMTVHGILSWLVEDCGLWRDALDGVVCTNRLAAALAVKEAGIEGRRVHYAPYGVELVARQEHRRRRDGIRLRIAWVGRLEDGQKRVLDIPKILGALDARGVEFDLVIAGAGKDETRLRTALSSWIARDVVHLVGTLDRTRLEAEVYDWADALLVTSSWETGPIVIWEAMTHGLAVVSSRYVGSGVEGSLKDGETCLLFAEGDAEAAADRLASLREHGFREQLVRQGRRLVSARYSRGGSIRAWSEAFERVLEAPPLERMPMVSDRERAGRLDRLVGSDGAEILRRLLHRRFVHVEPGAEWPHTYRGADRERESRFLDRVAALDRGVV